MSRAGKGVWSAHCAHASPDRGCTQKIAHILLVNSMIRHPPTAIGVTQQDVDELAAAQRTLLDSLAQHRRHADGQSAPLTTSKQKNEVAADRDGFEAEQRKRREMSVAERLGL